MLQYAIRRVLIGILTLWGITALTFILIRLMPGDPAALQTDVMNPDQSARIYELMRKQFHLDRPIHEQYFLWLGDVVQGDFGISFQYNVSVTSKIRQRVLPTISVAGISIVLGLVLSIPIGILQAAKHRGWFDRISGMFFYSLYAIPSYVMAIVAIYFVGVQWDLLPFRGMKSDGYDALTFAGKAKDLMVHGVLIVLCYTYQSIAFDSRFVRGNLLEVLRQDYVRTARAKGLPERVVLLKHAFRNTFIPLLTRLGFLIPAVMSGSVILEYIFSWPGLGQLFFSAIVARDYPVMMAGVVIASALVLIGILLADLAYAWADPRISYA